ncbi:metal ABC transporter permease [Moraxella canis]|uniref:metal ABC transporter permease n=1 Tax=Moraxella canis TaxID=90239 RepID=UPI000A74F7F4|nr:metal ABC transporter permease [Moraxella canis]
MSNSVLWWFTEPFSHTFMQHALISAVAVAVVCAILSCYIVLKGWSLMGDAISHAVFPGVVLAFWLGVPMTLGAFVAGMCCASAVGYLKNHTRLKEDTLMGVVFSGMFAVGLVMSHKIDSNQHLTHILFGNLLGISRTLMYQTAAISLVILMILLIKRRDLLLYCFDSRHAQVAGLSVQKLHYGLLILLSATIVIAMQAVGVILVIAMLISPGMTAFILCKRFDRMLMVAMISSCFTSVFGVIISYHLDSATGATIVLMQALVFLGAMIYDNLRLRRLSSA